MVSSASPKPSSRSVLNRLSRSTSLADVRVAASLAAAVQLGGIDIVAEQLRIVPGIRNDDVFQVALAVFQHFRNVALAAVIVEAVRDTVQIAQRGAVIIADDIISVVVVLVEIVRVCLHVNTADSTSIGCATWAGYLIFTSAGRMEPL